MVVDPTAVARIERTFRESLECGAEIGASVSLWRDGVEIATFSGGRTDPDPGRGSPWTHETLVPVYSATKGPAVATLLALLDDRGIELGTAVSELWPEFGQSGKSAFTLAELLSHRIGVAALDEVVETFDHSAVVAALERQAPLWPRGNGHGYHPRTFGFLVDELARRLTGGQDLGAAWRERFASPFGLDVWIGLPESEFPRVARLVPARVRAGEGHGGDPFLQALEDPASLARRAFASPRGLHAVSEMNQPRAWMAGLPAMGGVASARGLARFYSLLAGPSGPCSPRMRRWLETPLADGEDKVLHVRTVFAAGMMMDPIDAEGSKTRSLFGPGTRAFGHPGAGGSLAFGDPETGLGFAYVMNRMGRGALPGDRPLALVRALVGESDPMLPS